jgi:capsular polysaccharide biosynthesis protein
MNEMALVRDQARFDLDDLESLPGLSPAQARYEDGFVELVPSATSAGLAMSKRWKPLLLEWERIRSEFSPNVIPAAGYYRLRNIAFEGGGFLMRNGAVVLAPSIIPPYRRPEAQHHADANRHRKQAEPIRIEKTAILPVTVAYNEWGHWWLEMAHRLFPLYRSAPEIIEDASVVIPADLPQWARSCLTEIYQLRANQFVTYTPGKQCVLCRDAIVPTMLMKTEDMRFHPFMNTFIEHVIDHCNCMAIDTPAYDRLFLSRRNAHSIRSGQTRLANTDEVEALAESLGFKVISPESLGWKEQVLLLSRSRVVAGEHGSAMKNLLFAPRGSIMVSINYLNDSQSAIAALRGQEYVCLKCDGFDPNVPEQRYTVNIDRLRAVLELSKLRMDSPMDSISTLK